MLVDVGASRSWQGAAWLFGARSGKASHCMEEGAHLRPFFLGGII